MITNFSFDAMNRVTRRDVTQTPTGIARSNYTYFPGSGLLPNFRTPYLHNRQQWRALQLPATGWDAKHGSLTLTTQMAYAHGAFYL
jgi:hypothetical protein